VAAPGDGLRPPALCSEALRLAAWQARRAAKAAVGAGRDDAARVRRSRPPLSTMSVNDANGNSAKYERVTAEQRAASQSANILSLSWSV